MSQTTFFLDTAKAWGPCFISYFSTVCEAIFFLFPLLMFDIMMLSLFTTHTCFAYTSLSLTLKSILLTFGSLMKQQESGISVSDPCCAFRDWSSGLLKPLSQTRAKAIHMPGQSNSIQPHPIPWVLDNMFWALMLRLLLPIKCNALRRHVGNTLKKTFWPHQYS